MSTPLPDLPRLPEVPAGTESCGCCEGVEQVTPYAIDNRAGLATLSYRIGDWGDFRTSLHTGLSSKDLPALAGLRTRDPGDFSIGLLDAFACAADVLTFYQERIANESYLGTARERVSLEEMGRLIGYRLRPGVAAETLLAFTFESPPALPAGMKPEPGVGVSGVPSEVTIDPGLAVRSIPAPGQVPQVFETVEGFRGRAAWNAMQPWLSEVTRPARGDTRAWLAGTSTRLRAGDAILFVGAEYFADPQSNRWDFRILDSVTADEANNRTQVTWKRPLGSLDPFMNPAAEPRVFALRRRASVYGHNAPVWGTMPLDFQLRYLDAFDSSDLLIEAARPGSFEVETAIGLAGEPASPAPPSPASPSPAIARAASQEIPQQWPHFTISHRGDSVDLDSIYSEMPSGSLVVLAAGDFNYASEPGPAGTYVELYTVGNIAELSRLEFTLGSKVTRLQLIGANQSKFSPRVRDTTVFGQSEELRLAAYPIVHAVSGHSIPVAAPVDGFEAGRSLLVRGRRENGATLLHPATLVSATPAGTGRGVLTIDPPLPAPLERDTVLVFGNVALATHGETSTQILGAGNAAAAFQRFELKQLPLTHRAAPGEFGVAPAITVRVDDIAWQPRETLFGAGPKDRAYVLTTDEQGRQFVQFGDGARGARPSTGVNNLRAIYRKGLGAAGNVGAESLTQLAQRPLGLKGVSNPLPAEGGTDPETAGTARQAMPLLTRTLGRAVSVLDYEDFARGFAGVAKARAAVLQLATGPAVVITIAGPDGTVIQPTSPIYRNLADALVAGGDPYVTVRLLPHRPATFRVGLKIKCDAGFEARQVLAAVEATLRERFGFAARALGAPLRQSEVIAAAQSVRGVVAVDLDFLYGGTAPASQTVRSRQERLLAARMRVTAGEPQPDEQLTLHPGVFERLEEMK